MPNQSLSNLWEYTQDWFGLLKDGAKVKKKLYAIKQPLPTHFWRSFFLELIKNSDSNMVLIKSKKVIANLSIEKGFRQNLYS